MALACASVTDVTVGAGSARSGDRSCACARPRHWCRTRRRAFRGRLPPARLGAELSATAWCLTPRAPVLPGRICSTASRDNNARVGVGHKSGKASGLLHQPVLVGLTEPIPRILRTGRLATCGPADPPHRLPWGRPLRRPARAALLFLVLHLPWHLNRDRGGQGSRSASVLG
jgi:hypothetical protein